MVWPLWNLGWNLLKTLKIALSCDQMGIYLNDSKLTYVRDFCSLVIKATFKISKWWDQLGKEVPHIHTVEYFSAKKKKCAIWKKMDATGENHTRKIKSVSETQILHFLSVDYEGPLPHRPLLEKMTGTQFSLENNFKKTYLTPLNTIGTNLSFRHLYRSPNPDDLQLR